MNCRSILKTVGDSAYDFSVPTIWNKLPAHVRLMEPFTAFKTALKNYYSKESLH